MHPKARLRYSNHMQSFDNIFEFEEWLAPMGYEAFWEAIAPFGIFGPEDRAHCDRTLADGITDMQTMVCVIKGWASWKMSDRHGLSLFRSDICGPDLHVVE